MTEGGGGIAHEIWRAFEASPLGQALIWGGLGGLIAWWSVDEKDRRYNLRKQVLLGAIVAGGTQSLGVAVLKVLLGVDIGPITSGALTTASFFTGALGPAYFRMRLKRLSSEGGDDEE